MANPQPPYFIPIRTRKPADMSSISSADSAYGSATSESCTPSATHDISRVKYHVKHLESFVSTLQESASRAFPNRGRPSQRYPKVQALLLHWKTDDLFVLPELEDLEKLLREDYNFETDVFSIPSENSHLELMLKVGDMIKKHESEDTLFVVYYGGHARIDESRQSTWCATRHAGSPWLQWSAIQTLLERSISDALILLDCCAGAASATFPNGNSITETISASSWDAIAPDPGRYSFTNALIEVLSEWSNRTFSAAMLHAEILARLKHPRPIMINGKHFEARSTPVHFMMTSNHKAPSIEFSKIIPESRLPPSPPSDLPAPILDAPPAPVNDVPIGGEEKELAGPTIDEPHVMISLALEDDQRLDLNAWEEWLRNFPALAKHVKVQGVFRSHSTLLLLSLPVMVWDLLPEDPACSFVAFIRSNNLLRQQKPAATDEVDVSLRTTNEDSNREMVVSDDDDDGGEDDDGAESDVESETETEMGTERGDADSIFSGTTCSPNEDGSIFGRDPPSPLVRHRSQSTIRSVMLQDESRRRVARPQQGFPSSSSARPSLSRPSQSSIHGQASRRRALGAEQDLDLPGGVHLTQRVVEYLDEYFQQEPRPDASVIHFLASNLNIQPKEVHLFFEYRRQQQHTAMTLQNNLQNLRMSDRLPRARGGARMILPGYLHELLDIFPTKRVLVVDLRSPALFDKSHIHEAIGLRTPVSFVQDATLEMIQETFTDDQSRRTFAKWEQSRCVVFYDRVVEFSWECPVADALYDKFQAEGWTGQCFILKGHYHEFSSSFDKYIGGDKMTRNGKNYVDSLRQQPPPTSEQIQETESRYVEWLKRLENEDRLPTELIPTKKAERAQAVHEHQKELEAELEMRFPALARAAEEMHPAPPAYGAPDDDSDHHHRHHTGDEDPWAEHGKDTFDLKAPLVEPLSRGLAKMHEARMSPPPPPPTSDYKGTTTERPYRHSVGSGEDVGKPGSGGGGGGDWGSDDYDEIEKDESLRNDPAFQRAGTGLRGGGGEHGGSGDDALRKGGAGGGWAASQGQTPSFWKRLRPSAK